MRKTIINILITVALFVIIYLWLDDKYWQTLLETSLVGVFVSCFFVVSLYLLSGLQFYLTRKQLGSSLKLIDIALFPFVMGLWGHIFPFQGSVVFATVFFKQKYQMKISEGFSISLYLYLVTVIFTGLFGLVYALLNGVFLSVLGLLSLLFLINPAIFFFLNRILLRFGQSNIFIIEKIRVFVSGVVHNVSQFWQNVSLSLLVVSISVVRILIQVAWFCFISHSLGFRISVVEATFMSLIMSLSLILKFTPGNLGVAQLATGGFMALIGFQAEQAVVITLYSQAIMLILVSTVGLYGNFHYFNTLNILKLRTLGKGK